MKKFNNNNLHIAKNDKKDEFYTSYNDIAIEIANYSHHFKNKIVFCNCDNPDTSNFYRYFNYNFTKLKLKDLLTPYSNISKSPSTQKELDFRSSHCISLLEKADIVITNPPFSIFREYLKQLIEHNKKFLIIGNINAITYKEVFRLVLLKQMWFGYNNNLNKMEFQVPDDYPLNGAKTRIDNTGKKYITVKETRWFTNLEHNKRNDLLPLNFALKTKDYKKYDNYDAIEINRVAYIPNDYNGIMGVPITFLDKYNPNQFKIIGLAASAGYDASIVGVPKNNEYKDARTLINNKNTYARIFIQRNI
jgi:hypothetical protein